LGPDVGFVIKPWLSSRAFDDKEMVEDLRQKHKLLMNGRNVVG